MTPADTTRANDLWREKRRRDAWEGVPRDRAYPFETAAEIGADARWKSGALLFVAIVLFILGASIS